MPALRDYQQSLEDRILEALTRVHRVAVYAPTGSGKGHNIASLARRASERGRGGWVITPQSHLVDDLSGRFQAWGASHAVMQGRFKRKLSYRIQIITNMSVDTLANEIEDILAAKGFASYAELMADDEASKGLPPAPDFVIVDEGHYALKGQRRLMRLFPKARFIAFSGSPIGMYPTYSELILGPSTGELMLDRKLVPVYVHEARPIDPTMLKKAPDGALDLDYYWAEALRRGHVVGDVLKSYERFCRDRHTIIRTGHKKAGHAITLMLQNHGVPAAYVDGSTSRKTLRELIDSFSTIPGSVLVHPDLLSQGADIPRADTLIATDPTESLRTFCQNLGRIMRPLVDKGDQWLVDAQGKPLKEFGLFLDHAGWTNTHGSVYGYQPEDWLELFHQRDGVDEKVIKRRSKAQERRVGNMRCQQCGCEYTPAPKCPVCGWHKSEYLSMYTVYGKDTKGNVKRKFNGLSSVAGELFPVGSDVEPHMREAQRQTYLELRGFAEAAGYKSGWAYRQFLTRYKRKPEWAWNDLEPHRPGPGTLAWMKNAGFRIPESLSRPQREEVSA